MDTLVLGCTHYPFAAEVLRAHVGDGVAFLEGGAPVARQTRRLLEARAWLAAPTQPAANQPIVFGTTGKPSQLQSALERWLHLPADVQALRID